MKKALLLSAVLALAASPQAIEAKGAKPFELKPGMWKSESSTQKLDWHFTKSNAKANLSKIVTKGDITMDSQNGFDYLDMPDGTNWLVELNYERVVDQEFEGGYVDYKYTGLKGTVYNDKFQKVGEINTPIELPEGMEKCTSIQMSQLVTKKFFNHDENYEIMFTAYFRPIGDFGAVPYTFILSLKGENTPASHVMTIPGYYVSSVNTATDKWGEEFYMNFFGAQSASSDDDYAVTFDIYSKATYGSEGPTKIESFTVDMAHAPEMTGNEPAPIMMTANGRDLYVTVAQYDKPYYNNAGDPNDSSVTPENSYSIKLYKKSAYAKEFSLESTTTIPCEAAPEGFVYRSYALGLFNATNDISFDFTDDGSVSYIIGVTNIDNQFEAETTYRIIDTEGKTIKTFGENCESYGLLSQIDGYPEQYVFVENDPDVVGGLVYRFVDYPSFETKAMIPCTFIDDSVDGGSNLLSMNMDRTPAGSSYNYVFSVSTGHMKGNDVCHEIVWMNAEGDFLHVDVINAGPNVMLINPYVRSAALNPYLFNTDSNREYMYYSKVRTNASDLAAHAELRVCNNKGETLLNYAFGQQDSGMSTTLLNLTSNPAIWIQYQEFSTSRFVCEYISLPLNKLQGSGTVEDPYLLTSAGDFSLIKNNLAANYRVANDIDFENGAITSTDAVFTGSLDGAGHTLRNLVIKDKPIFKSLYSSNVANPCVVKDLTLSHVTVDGASAILSEGGTSGNVKISNVHIFKAKVDDGSDAAFSALINRTGVNTEITGCSFDVDFNRPSAEYFGGLVGDMGRGGSIIACSVTGTVKAGANIGGIAYSTNNADTEITDCHVNLDIEGDNTIGGIVADAERGTVKRNIIEGSIKANTPGFAFYKNKRVETMNVGGVLGILKSSAANYDSNGNLLPEVTDPIVTGNVVALSSITIPEGKETLTSTTHRIVGRSRINESPEYVGEEENPNYDPNDPESEEWIITWGNPAPAEACLTNNYALDDLAVVDATVGEGQNLTEGASLSSDKLEREFFEGLGYKFEGYSTEEPWHYGYTMLPELYFEQTAGASLVFNPAAISIRKGDKATVVLSLEKASFEDITFDQSSDTGFSFNPTDIDENGNVTIEIEMFEEGAFTLTARFNTISATLAITGMSGIDGITSDNASAISYDGYTVSANGCAIAIYNVAGSKVAEGYEAVSVTSLVQGIYVATATDADGKKSSIKIAVK